MKMPIESIFCSTKTPCALLCAVPYLRDADVRVLSLDGDPLRREEPAAGIDHLEVRQRSAQEVGDLDDVRAELLDHEARVRVAHVQRGVERRLERRLPAASGGLPLRAAVEAQAARGQQEEGCFSHAAILSQHLPSLNIAPSLNISTPQHLNTSTSQHLNISTSQHLNPQICYTKRNLKEKQT